ncbi:Hypothetical protein RMHFA_04194 [Roseomonas mucosa]|nr:Hypothetical protein RMHFA_04194 [Roseomonas mucosa]
MRGSGPPPPGASVTLPDALRSWAPVIGADRTGGLTCPAAPLSGPHTRPLHAPGTGHAPAACPIARSRPIPAGGRPVLE